MGKSKRTDSGLCEWCCDDERSIYRKHLCRSCYNIERKLARTEKNLASDPKNLKLEMNFLVARRQAEIARLEGERYGHIAGREIDGDRIEYELRALSQHFLGKEMFWGCYSTFDWDFKSKQRRIIFEYLSAVMRQYMRKHAFHVALNTAHLKDGWQEFI